MSNRPPPELPPFMVASVCMSVIVPMPSTLTSRLVVDTMPCVTVPPSMPKGLPIATTSVPTLTVSLSAMNVATESSTPSGGSMESTAMSRLGALPMSVAG